MFANTSTLIGIVTLDNSSNSHKTESRTFFRVLLLTGILEQNDPWTFDSNNWLTKSSNKMFPERMHKSIHISSPFPNPERFRYSPQLYLATRCVCGVVLASRYVHKYAHHKLSTNFSSLPGTCRLIFARCNAYHQTSAITAYLTFCWHTHSCWQSCSVSLSISRKVHLSFFQAFAGFHFQKSLLATRFHGCKKEL